MEIDLSEFKEINGFSGMYLIDKNGNVYSKYINRFLKQTLFHGYYAVVLYDSKTKEQISKYVHRLVAEYFIENPDNLLCVNHKDENKLNNNIENLEWCTKSYNNTYNDIHIKRGKKCSETIRKNGGSHNRGIPMSEEQKEKIRKSCKNRKFAGNQYVDKFGNKK